MLGTVDRSHANRIVEALSRRDAGAVLAEVDALRGLGLSAAGTLEEVARLLQQMAVEQALPGALDPSDSDTEAARALAAALPADETQLLYSIALHGRAELSLAPDEYAGLVMVLLRFMAFPAGGPGGGSAAPPARQPDGGAGALARPQPAAPADPAAQAMPGAQTAPAPQAVRSAHPVAAAGNPAVASAAAASPAPSSAAGAARATAAGMPAGTVAPPAAAAAAIPPAVATAPEPARTEPAAGAMAPAAAPGARAAAVPAAPLLRPGAPRAVATAAPRAIAAAAVATAADDSEPPWGDEEPDILVDDLPAPTRGRMASGAPGPASRSRADFDEPEFVAEADDRADDGAAQPRAARQGGLMPPPLQSFERTELGTRWYALISQCAAAGALIAMVRALAMQSELVGCDSAGDPQVWRLRVGLETLRNPALAEKLALVLRNQTGHNITLAVEAGEAQDCPLKRDAAEADRRQRAAVDSIQADPTVLALLAQFQTARILPGSIKPL